MIVADLDIRRRLNTEQEDAILAVSERCGYVPEAVERAFRARFWPKPPEPRRRDVSIREGPQLDHAVDL